MSLVLIVEDDPLLRATLSIQLRYGKFHTMEAASARDALRLAGQHKFDLAVVDHGLPDQAGDELVSKLQQFGIPCILFTGMDEAEALLVATRAGAVACLIKPVDMATLLSAVSSAITPPAAR